jgi:hypothetical protein
VNTQQSSPIYRRDPGKNREGSASIASFKPPARPLSFPRLAEIPGNDLPPSWMFRLDCPDGLHSDHCESRQLFGHLSSGASSRLSEPGEDYLDI